MLATTEYIDVTYRELLRGCERAEPFPESLLEQTSFSTYHEVASGRAGLLFALRSANVGPGDEVIIPSYSCSAVRQAVEQFTNPTYVDINIPEFTLDMEELVETISNETKAVLPIHTYGRPCDMETVAELARAYDVTVIEDACQALGNTVLDSEVGKHSDYCVFSFRFFKEATGYHGGVVLCDEDMKRADSVPRLPRLKLCGTYAAAVVLNGLPGKLYEPLRKHVLDPASQNASKRVEPAERKRLTEWQRTIIGSQYERLDARVSRRRQNAKVYNQSLPERFVRPEIGPHHSFFRYPLLVPNEERESLVRQLRRRGVGCSTMYSYTLPDEECYPGSERTAREVLLLPNHAGIGEDEVERIAKIVADVQNRTQSLC